MLIAFSWVNLLGWILFVVAIAIGVFGLWIINSAGNSPDWMATVGKGIAVIGMAVVLGTAALRMAGVLPPEWVDDPLNL